ncbi:hypothetical protein B0H21DRAFT_689975, partial [Amylocystis lapponica]
VLALNITVGGTVGTIPASEFLTVNDAQLMNDCQTQCAPGMSAIQACGDTNDACLCDSATVTSITACEQCMFNDIITLNARVADPRAGSTPALAAYAAACLLSNITVPATEITLVLPSNWDGPFGLGVGTVGTAITVIVGAMLGSGAIYVVNTM